MEDRDDPANATAASAPDRESSHGARAPTPHADARTRRGADGGEATPPDTLRIDERQKRVYMGRRRLQLSHGEFDLLCLLASDPGRVFSNREILEALWASHGPATAGDVRQSIYLLRQRIEIDPHRPRRIETVRGFGYRLAVPLEG